MVARINNPSLTPGFAVQVADWLQFTASEERLGNITRVTLTPKAGVTWAHTFTLSADTYTPYVNDSIRVATSGGNDNPEVATSVWEEVYAAPDGVVPTTTTVIADTALTEAARMVLAGNTARIFTANGAVLSAHARDESTLGSVTETTENSTWAAVVATTSAIKVAIFELFFPLIKVTHSPEASTTTITYDLAGTSTAVTPAAGQSLSFIESEDLLISPDIR